MACRGYERVSNERLLRDVLIRHAVNREIADAENENAFSPDDAVHTSESLCVRESIFLCVFQSDFVCALDKVYGQWFF